MSEITSIQWADSTTNPVMGCGGCELFPSAGEIMRELDARLGAACPWSPGDALGLYTRLSQETYDLIQEPHPNMQRCVSPTNVWHLRDRFFQLVQESHGKAAREIAKRVIEEKVTCYAAKIHMNKGTSIVNPGRKLNPGYAPVFSKITPYPGRMAKAASYSDLLGTRNDATPWKHDLPRMIFVSDMGDALSRRQDFPFLKTEIIGNVTSETGKRHLWLWLSKRPHLMEAFAQENGGLPPNLCAMTTLTSANPENLKRLQDLKRVRAYMKGLSLEPLWERIPPAKLNLAGIDWVIVGGESGSPREFPLEWALELRDHCQAQGVAFFCKQWGRRPTYAGKRLHLKDRHGGDWDEWRQYLHGESLRIREFPKKFHAYRHGEPGGKGPRPVSLRPKNKKSMKQPVQKPKLTPEQTTRFSELDKKVKAASKGLIDGCIALEEIRRERLYRDRYPNFDAYCHDVHSMSRQYADRLIAAGKVYHELETIVSNPEAPRDVTLPRNELQLTTLKRAAATPEKRMEIYVQALEEVGGDADRVTAKLIREKGQSAAASSPCPPKPIHRSPSVRLREAHILLLQLKEELDAAGYDANLIAKLEKVLDPAPGL